MSFTRNDRIVCDGCGKFISMQDLMDDKATHHCVLDDTEFSKETFESFCPKCVAIAPSERAKNNEQSQ
jgi:hypothetical protein